MSHNKRIYCSRCGAKSRYRSCGMTGAWDHYNAGWRSCGTALYCPKCSRSWHERNDIPLDNFSPFVHISRIMDYQIMDLESDVRYLEEELHAATMEQD